MHSVGLLLAVGAEPEKTAAAFCKASGRKPPPLKPVELATGETLAWRPNSIAPPVRVRSEPRGERVRHSRKYAEGSVGPERSFTFTGPEGKLNLKAQNLVVFLQMADGVDDETWMHHLRRNDYSRWFREEIKNDELAAEAAEVEGAKGRAPEREPGGYTGGGREAVYAAGRQGVRIVKASQSRSHYVRENRLDVLPPLLNGLQESSRVP